MFFPLWFLKSFYFYSSLLQQFRWQYFFGSKSIPRWSCLSVRCLSLRIHVCVSTWFDFAKDFVVPSCELSNFRTISVVAHICSYRCFAALFPWASQVIRRPTTPLEMLSSVSVGRGREKLKGRQQKGKRVSRPKGETTMTTGKIVLLRILRYN